MKLNMDCMRNILLILESKTPSTSINFEKFCKLNKLKNYSITEIEYACKKLSAYNYINLKTTYNNSAKDTLIILYVNNLTQSGNDFLKNIKNDQVWNKTKFIANRMELFSLRNIKSIALQIISENI